jgi:hypothetical protein
MKKWMQRAISVEAGPQARLLMQCELSVLRGDYAAAKPGLEQLPAGFYGYRFTLEWISLLRRWQNEAVP